MIGLCLGKSCSLLPVTGWRKPNLVICLIPDGQLRRFHFQSYKSSIGTPKKEASFLAVIRFGTLRPLRYAEYCCFDILISVYTWYGSSLKLRSSSGSRHLTGIRSIAGPLTYEKINFTIRLIHAKIENANRNANKIT